MDVSSYKKHSNKFVHCAAVSIGRSLLSHTIAHSPAVR
jgi:hypothetical protein